MNRTVIVGNLASDPEVKGEFIELTIADNPRGDKAKARYKTNFVRATFKAGSSGATIAQECKKGDKVTVIGQLMRREFEGKSGKGVSMEIPFVDAIERLAGAGPAAPDAAQTVTDDPFGL